MEQQNFLSLRRPRSGRLEGRKTVIQLLLSGRASRYGATASLAILAKMPSNSAAIAVSLLPPSV